MPSMCVSCSGLSDHLIEGLLLFLVPCDFAAVILLQVFISVISICIPDTIVFCFLPLLLFLVSYIT